LSQELTGSVIVSNHGMQHRLGVFQPHSVWMNRKAGVGWLWEVIRMSFRL